MLLGSVRETRDPDSTGGCQDRVYILVLQPACRSLTHTEKQGLGASCDGAVKITSERKDMLKRTSVGQCSGMPFPSKHEARVNRGDRTLSGTAA